MSCQTSSGHHAATLSCHRRAHGDFKAFFYACADSLSPFQFYQYLLTSVGDADVCSFLRKLTFLPLQQIAEVEASMAQPGYAPNTAQRLLASEVTRFVHGEGGLQQALRATEVGSLHRHTLPPGPAASFCAAER